MITNRTKIMFQNAIKEGDARLVGSVVDQLRFTHGCSYHDCYRLAFEFTGIAEADWEELLYEADHVAK
jgi:hypothetical protein